MSQPTPQEYERGRGMDAHNRVMRDIRGRNDTSQDPREPTRVWFDRDNTPDGLMDSLTIVLNTGGCRWARAGGCTMCGYVAESVEGGTVDHEDIMAQVDVALERERTREEGTCRQVKIYTSGSFFDEREIPAQTRHAIAEHFSDRDRIVLESLPDFVDRNKVWDFLDRGLSTDVAIGLETASDRVREDCINKYFDFTDFEEACDEVVEAPTKASPDAGVKAYLLLKPPFLSESDAIDDAIESIRRCSAIDGVHTISLNPTNVHRYTMVEQLYFEGGYRPPWLWSVLKVLRETVDEDVTVISDPVGSGSDRGPHNCKTCDDRVTTAIEDFNLRQDPSVFTQVACECEDTWQAVCERETSYSTPLGR